MSEQPAESYQHMWPEQGASATPEQITHLLENPDLKLGLAAADDKVAEYCADLEAEGKHIETGMKGITASGNCVQVIEWKEPKASQNDFSIQGGRRSTKFSVFVYPLSEVTTTDFKDDLRPRSVGYVQSMSGGGIYIDVAKPGWKFTITQAHVRQATHERAAQSDPEARKALRKAAAEQSKQADKLFLPQSDSAIATFNGEPIIAFDDATFGSRRQAVVNQVVAPLDTKYVEHRDTWINDITNKEVERKEKAAMRELAKRKHQTSKIMRANPTMVDEGPELIHDPAKAEYIAYEVDRVHKKKAGQVAVKAAAKYGADPLGVFEDKSRGFLGRLRK